MPEEVAGFPFWEIAFDEAGAPVDAGMAAALPGAVAAAGVTDLYIFAHGWNNSRAMAHALYADFFAGLRAVLDDPATPPLRPATIGALGVIWPSMRWEDEAVPAVLGGGAALHGAAPPSDEELVESLKSVFTRPQQRRALDQMARLLRERPPSRERLRRFRTLMARLVDEPTGAAEDDGELALLTEPPGRVFERFAAVGAPPVVGGGAGVGDLFGRLWNGAKQALRALTYFEMKRRAGVVGQAGLGPLLGELAAARPGLRLHLLGHSFGARLVAFALAGLPDGATGTASPVKSLLLLQGAFSHFAFADALPHDQARSGALAGMAARVDGPLLVTHSLLDTAISEFYPAAALLGTDDASGVGDLLFRWGAMGRDGAQAVAAESVLLGPVGTSYDLVAGRFINLDGNAVIDEGGPPAGAHGDILGPQIAWAALAAAGIG